MQKFKGTFTMMITPFSGDGCRIEEAVLRDFVDWQIEQGVAGLIPLGSTGEFLSLSDEERHLVASVVIRQANGRVPVIIGTGAECATDVVRFSRDAEALGASGVMVIPPFYSTPTEDEIERHYELVGKAVSIPVMVYNNPATANVDMSPQLLARLSKIENVAYVKESTMDATRVRDIARLSDNRMGVFGGILGFESFMNGAVGWTAVGANVMPRDFAAMYRLCVTSVDLEAARDLYRKIHPVIEIVGKHRYVSATKMILELMGLPVGPPRPPRLPFDGGNLGWAKRIVAEMGLTFRGGG
ncbi:dihydrodipicolinate synthase family protein [Povalibacter sp.]|uniref:dihydrodipicolinate synthase family protein n=1 Tax=Povalibacter sp. TaxID=1962978 RepID=UPI002F41EFCC